MCRFKSGRAAAFASDSAAAAGTRTTEAPSEKTRRTEPATANRRLAESAATTTASREFVAGLFTTSMRAFMTALHFNGRAMRKTPATPARYPAGLSCLQSDFL